MVDINWVDGRDRAPSAGVEERWIVDSRHRHSAPPPWRGAVINSEPIGATRVRRQVVLLPPNPGQEGVEGALSAVGAGAPRLLRVCPGRHGHNFLLADWVLQPLPEMCERAGLSLAVDYVDHTSPPKWTEVLEFANSHPTLPIVLIGGLVDEDRSIHAVLDHAPNLILEVSAVRDPDALAPLANRYGAHRFIFGSGGDAEALDRWTPVGFCEDETAQIFGGNAQALDEASWQRMFL